MSATLRDAVVAHIRKVREIQVHVRGNDQATRQSLIGPLFSLLGYDLTDPRECIPGFRGDTSKGQPATTIDWVFLSQGKPLFFVSARAAEEKLVPLDGNLATFFGNYSDVKLGIATNGLQWRFYTDMIVPESMDPEPFLIWDLTADEQVPIDVLNFLSILQKSQFQPEVIKAYAQTNSVRKNLIVTELERLLEPSTDFIKLAVGNLETRKLTDGVIDYWKPIVANAIHQWARVKTLTSVISQANTPAAQDSDSPEPQTKPQAIGTANANATANANVEKEWQKMKALTTVITNSPAETEHEEALGIRQMVTTDDEAAALEIFQELCGESRPLGSENTLSSFNIHYPQAPTAVIARFHLRGQDKSVWFPMDQAKCGQLCPGIKVKPTQFAAWTSCPLRTINDLRKLQGAVRESYDTVKAQQSKQSTLSIDYVFEKIA